MSCITPLMAAAAASSGYFSWCISAVGVELKEFWSRWSDRRRDVAMHCMRVSTVRLSLLAISSAGSQWRREGICRPGQTSVLPYLPTHGVFTGM